MPRRNDGQGDDLLPEEPCKAEQTSKQVKVSD